MADDIELSITIVNMNNRALLRECLGSLFGQDHRVAFEVIIVDNASTDGSADMLRSDFPQVRLIVNDARKGFGANQNQAIRASVGRYVLLLNDDTLVRPGALRGMCDCLAADPRAGAVGCRLENPDGSLQLSCYKFPTPFRCLAENLLLTAAFPNGRLCGDYRAWSHNELRAVEFVSGAAIMVRRQVVEEVGLFDEKNFFMYAEETDWCYRMHLAGWKVLFTPTGTIVHYGGQSSATMKNRQFCEFNRSARRYILKHYGPLGVAVQHVAYITGSLMRLASWSAIYLVKPCRREKAAQRLKLWWMLLRWWLGLGPNEGIAELAARPAIAASAK